MSGTEALTLAFLALGAAATFDVASALYSSGSGVVDLNPNNFDNKVRDSDALWVVEFYAPWCGHCQQLVPEYQKAAKALKGVVGVGGVDCDQHKSLCGEFGVRGFPTIKILGADKKKPEDYQGQRTADAIVSHALSAAQSMVRQRLSGKKSSSGSSSSGSGSGGGGGDVVELTESNFDKLVLKSDEAWLVEFFAPWCGHCKNLEPHWKSAARELKGKVKLGAVDATVYQQLAAQHDVKGYPTIKYFPAGLKKSTPEDYDGGRTSSDIVSWALSRHVENLPDPELVQITGVKVVEEHCENKPLCVVAFLPHILDCQSQCRKDYMATIESLAKDSFKKQGWGWLWSEGGAQPEFEDALEVGGFGYPAMAVINHKKMKFSKLAGSFGREGIREFLRDLSYGKGRTSTVKGAKLPGVTKVEPWDGKDGALPEEEDMDLSDIELDDLPPSKKTEL